MTRSTRIVLFVIALLTALTSAQIAQAAVTEYREDFEDGAISAPFTLSHGDWSEASVVSAGVAHGGAGSSVHRIAATAQGGTSSGVNLLVPAGGTRYEFDGWVYVDEACNWGSIASFVLMQCTDGSVVGTQISPDSNGEPGYWGLQGLTRYSQLSSPWKYFTWSFPQRVWRHLQVDFDTAEHVVTVLIDGSVVVNRQAVTTEATPCRIFFGTAGGWRPGNHTTQYLDDITVRVTTPDAPAPEPSGATAMRARDAGDAMHSIQQVVPALDTIAPSVSAALGGVRGSAGWYRSDVRIALSAIDAGGSEVDRIEYSLDGGATWNRYTDAIVVSKQGPSTVHYRAIDTAGNVSETGTRAFKIDSIAPAVSIASPRGVYWAGETVVVAWSATDAGSGLAEVTPFAPAGSTLTIGFGEHTSTMTARDAAGNVTVASTTWSASASISTSVTGSKRAGTSLAVWANLRDASGAGVSGKALRLAYRRVGAKSWTAAAGPRGDLFVEKAPGDYKRTWKTPSAKGAYELKITVDGQSRVMKVTLN